MSDSIPYISVIMPIRNEADFIERSLEAVLMQDYPRDCFEVLIADGMSTDQTRTIVEATAAQHPDISVRIIDNPRQIVPTGFNAALAHARGEIIVRVDGHAVIASDYITRCVEHLQSSDAWGVGGPIDTIGTDGFGETVALAMSSSFGVGNSAFRTVKDKMLLVDTVAFPAYTRQAIGIAGPLDEELVRNQDDEYNYRLRKLGAKILLAPDIKSKYYSRSTPRALWRQYYQYGFYKVRVLQKHPAQMRPRQFVPPLFVLSVVVGAVLASFSNLLRRLWTAGLAAYGLANLAASIKLARAHGWEHLKRLPLVFFILHFSYGLGFLAGLVHFRDRWGR
mgnify:FL=1